ncbi:BamA/TamA family outer membrane protein [Gemmata sp. G18]|uniref:BamA/TamA family outer membrane protein n=1 Tax=Gemmata palustris TaxID=2822762 RepID=A0ABS5BVB9_9BACT|nr:M1 family aminopeptidase [Gemmata palustris]MBP3956848.1 BamA/TamA family outer membrane protein [Gemmata palustris]
MTWTNTTKTATNQLVFNFYPHFQVPAGESLLFAKTLELLRLQPSLGIDRDGKMGNVTSAHLLGANAALVPLNYSYDEKNTTALRFELPNAVQPGQSATIELVCDVRLPNKQGRWGHYEGVTFLTNAIPLLAVCDDGGWKPMPFVPWHQPWYNEAGVFRATITVPENEKVACSAVIKSEQKLPGNKKKVECEPFLGRDFAVLSSARYQEFISSTKLPDGREVKLRCLAFPEHEFYATEILKIVGEAITTFSQWFGAYPYSQFTVAESYFGWNGNECGGLIMVDERVFGMPHLARGYVEYLVSHETCHQWWYNMIGTNGFTEPYLDEGAAAYFTHRLVDTKRGKNNPLLAWPKGLEWLPNINRENYRNGSMYHAIRNGEMTPAAQELPQYKHLFGLFTGAYDRGSKVFAMIEDRLGEAAFLDFIRGVVKKYSWNILSSELLRAELEAYTGRDWGEFFQRWVFGKGLTDWSVERVRVEALGGPRSRTGYAVSVTVKQSREFTEPTLLEFTRGATTVRVPVGPFPETVKFEQHNATATPIGDNRWRVDLELPFEPEQVTVDPDGVLLDANPNNNRWKPSIKTHVTPLYTMLDETGLTADYNRWNFLAGPWVWGPAAQDPWYTRSTMLGLRAGGFRTERYATGAYTAIRSDYRDAIVGVDGKLLFEHREIGANWETRIGGPWGGLDGASGAQRGSIYARNIHKESASLYLPPMFYDEAFATYQDNFLPFARRPGGDRWDRLWMAGWHVRLNLYTPYWDPECGLWADAMAAGGQADFADGWKPMAQARAELAAVHTLPEWTGPFRVARIAGRVVGQFATPDRGQFFALGGGTLFRGFDLAERQGSALWVGNLEMRWPLARNVTWDALDHSVGARNVWLATFYDVGAVYANGRAVGGNVAHAVGAGLRVDVAVFSFIERATLRFDVGKSLNGGTPLQFWFGVQHSF